MEMMTNGEEWIANVNELIFFFYLQKLKSGHWLSEVSVLQTIKTELKEYTNCRERKLEVLNFYKTKCTIM